MSDAHRSALALLVILAAGFALNARCLQIGFLADDYDLFYAVTRPDHSLFDRFPAGQGAYFRPAAMWSLRSAAFLTTEPALHHAVNLGIHLANGALLFGVLRISGCSRLLAAALAMHFLAHRVAVPNVFWISARPELLAATGGLTALIGIAIAISRSVCRLSMAAVAMGTLLAVLSKESGIILPVILFLFAWTLRSTDPDTQTPRNLWQLYATATAISIMCAGYLLVRFSDPGRIGVTPPLQLASGAIRGFVLLLLPISEWDLHRLKVNPAIPIILLSASGVATWALWRQQRRHLRAFAIAGLLPITAFVPVLIVQGGGAARLLYFPAALAVLAAGVLAPILFNARNTTIVTLGFAAIMAGGSIYAASDWVANDRIAKACCRDFISLSSDTPVIELPILIAPRQIGDAPVLSNDSRAALYHCRYRRFGYLSIPPPVAEAVLSGRNAAIERVDSDPNTTSFRLRKEDGWFVIPIAGNRHLRIGDQVETLQGTLRVTQPLLGQGSVSAFSFSPGAAASRMIHFDGKGLALIRTR